MFRKLVIAVSIGVAMLGTSASAQGYDPDRVIGSVQLADLKAIVASLDHELVSEGDQGDVSVDVRADDGTRYLLIGTVCNTSKVDGCLGVKMQVIFGSERSISDFDLVWASFQQAALNIWRDPEDGTIGVTRYVVLDYGVTMGNLRENVRVLLGGAPKAVAAMLEP